MLTPFIGRKTPENSTCRTSAIWRTGQRWDNYGHDLVLLQIRSDLLNFYLRDLVAIITVLEFNQWFTKLSTKDYKLVSSFPLITNKLLAYCPFISSNDLAGFSKCSPKSGPPILDSGWIHEEGTWNQNIRNINRCDFIFFSSRHLFLNVCTW